MIHQKLQASDDPASPTSTGFAYTVSVQAKRHAPRQLVFTPGQAQSLPFIVQLQKAK
ncbi:MAG: hypothetical protein HN742_40170 [Lentisphaerae bacterium]|nr:hypothetical protein [Lentisphaerota bacterium]MBT5607387.1 hypothetical protein [Lentisphaerota bacterium]MBT7057819.1 hypothetical protein [Lentisphaerota bacterium]MBT7848152.1 hypothetical protein [Lentisphaerota bacterium]